MAIPIAYGLFEYGTVPYSAPAFVQWIIPLKNSVLWTSMEQTIVRFPVVYGAYLYSKGPKSEPTLYNTVSPDNQWVKGQPAAAVWTTPVHP